MNRHQYLVYTYLDFTFRFLVLIAYFICITLRDTLTEMKKKTTCEVFANANDVTIPQIIDCLLHDIIFMWPRHFYHGNSNNQQKKY